ncbi:hypothetical protein [Azospirillum sp. ST 5-10]|uniref:hypothetical protein n=1 Tax=unclassified Azospirillum TaxID=2630922 RepID=UPI003F49D6E4
MPPDLGPALDLVRGLWREGRSGGLSRQVLAWAMMIEAVDHLTLAHGPAATAGLLDRLSDAVQTTPRPGRGSLQ